MENNLEWLISFITIYLASAVGIVIHDNAEKKVILQALDIVDYDLIITDLHTEEKIDALHSLKRVILICNEWSSNK